jgi:hypothetical protein
MKIVDSVPRAPIDGSVDTPALARRRAAHRLITLAGKPEHALGNVHDVRAVRFRHCPQPLVTQSVRADIQRSS